MAETHTKFVGSIPAIYDEHLGPLLFEHYAADLAMRVEVPADGRVLETACGTGISTRFLREALPGSVEIVATDLNEPMLDYAREKLGGMENLRFEQADALSLPFDDQSFDAVVNQFGVMFYPDKAAGMGEALRVLKPGALSIFNVWDSFEHNPAPRIMQEVISSFFANDPPTFMQTPFGYYDHGVIRSLLADTGFGEIEFSELPTVIEMASAAQAAKGLVEGNPTILEVNERASAPAEDVVAAVAEAIREAFGDAPTRIPMRAIMVTARRKAGLK